MDGRNKKAVLLLILLVALCIAALFARARMTSGGKTAVIYQNGEIIRSIALDKIDEPVEFNITGSGGETNTVRAENGRIRIVSASCPDKICVNQGWIENGVVPVVCLPNKVTIEISGVKNDIDAQAGGV